MIDDDDALFYERPRGLRVRVSARQPHPLCVVRMIAIAFFMLRRYGRACVITCYRLTPTQGIPPQQRLSQHPGCCVFSCPLEGTHTHTHTTRRDDVFLINDSATHARAQRTHERARPLHCISPHTQRGLGGPSLLSFPRRTYKCVHHINQETQHSGKYASI